MNGGAESDGCKSPTSEGSKDSGLIIAPIQVVMKFDDDSDEESDQEQVERRVRKKKTKSKTKEPKADKTAMLTKTFGQAIRLINEAKVNPFQLRSSEARPQHVQRKTEGENVVFRFSRHE